MKRIRNVASVAKLTLAALVLSCLAATVYGQDSGSAQTSGTSTGKSSSRPLTSSSVHEHHSSEIPRFWFGLSGSYVPFKLESVSSNTNSTTGEYISSTNANGEAGGGAVVNLRVYGSYWLSVGSIYRFGGYDTNDLVNSSTAYLERTRARFLDFPVLVRYTGPHFRWSRYSFYELGGSLRYAEHINLQQAASNGFNYYCCAPPSTTAIHRATEGVTVGTGVSGKDDFGIIVSPEVRYTYWVNSTFSSPTVSTMKNQLEVTVSFGW